MEQEFITNNDDNELTLVPDPFLEVSCSFLGVRGDASTPMAYPTANNQCYALKPVRNVDLVKQRRHCLSDGYSECSYFQQQMANTAKEKKGEPRDAVRKRRKVNGRTLALAMMLVLILLAVLIWWPPPGTSIEEGTVFGVSFNLNSPNFDGESAKTSGQTDTAQRGGEESGILTNAKAGDVKKSNTLEKTTSQGSAVEANQAEGNLAPEAAGVNLPEGEENVQAPAAKSTESSKAHTGFTIISYEGQGSDREMLNVYMIPGSGHYVRIARPELFSLLGRDAASEWLKIGTDSGIEGWVLVSDTELGSWVSSLTEIER
jgi:hypothetical protein